MGTETTDDHTKNLIAACLAVAAREIQQIPSQELRARLMRNAVAAFRDACTSEGKP
jgi:hypothetical protein